MIAGYGILVPLFLATLWAFLRFSPKSSRGETVKAYNIGTFVVALALGVGYAVRLYVAMSSGSDFGWWPVVAPLAVLAISSGVLILSGILRNWVFFRVRGELSNSGMTRFSEGSGDWGGVVLKGRV